MNAKQRLIAAIRQQPVDRLPVMTYNFHPYGGEWEQRADGAYVGPPAYQPMMDAVFATGAGMLCKVSARRVGERAERSWSEQSVRGTSAVTDTYVETPKGTLHMRYEKPTGQPGYYVESLISSDADVEKYLSLPNTPATLDLSPAIAVYEALGDRGLAYLSYTDPMYDVAWLFDFEDFCLRCVTQRALIVEMIERAQERAVAELAPLLEQARGREFLFYTVGPEVATPPMLSPRTFAELVTPYERTLVRMVQEAGQLCAIHCHGRVRLVLDQFLEIGIDALEPLEPPPQGDITLAEALDVVDGRICLMGYIQDQDLYTAQPGEMRDKVRAIRQIVAGRTGYIMTSSATPYMHPPPPAFVSNYVEYLEAAAE
ncbi:MAG: hypothetical protein JXA09_02485 [Anaerolineae bacterium]|nr:hypothetical protein [Anaerolineae bacterium]